MMISRELSELARARGTSDRLPSARVKLAQFAAPAQVWKRQILFSNSGFGCQAPRDVLAGPTALSAVGACPPHNGVRRRWWINVASAVSLTESSQKIWRSHHRHRPGRDLFSRGRGNSVISLCVLGSSLFPRPVELSLVDPH